MSLEDNCIENSLIELACMRKCLACGYAYDWEINQSCPVCAKRSDLNE